ncbi:hypothetical protein [Nonomuraea gerenzanensis]|uniref:Uncharacterized protein n=1 Tax=Nonomuraea gerenzanensis TaxID=93944 RepID=A0A1M4EMW5_9ACTN|nr:hypothetical protein [Nonomuraea gerenzanensis]UBU11681.1 hypothetical protein LCN96_46485 [Nonomuraea gerenzanensis]SBP00179.1 hypothetical protein BN4615_P9695 [Nonomuraea gerenzanensis]
MNVVWIIGLVTAAGTLGPVPSDAGPLGPWAFGAGALGSGALGSGAPGSGALGAGALGAGALGAGALGSSGVAGPEGFGVRPFSPDAFGARAAEKGALSCAVATPAARPLVFEPKLGLTPRRVAARGHLELTGCTSPDGTAALLRSGWGSVKATAQASCTSARQVRGSAVITWFGANGRPVGTSRLRVRADRLVARRPADTLLTGTVAAGWLAGKPVKGGITPAMGLLGCATQGMATLPGSGRIVFG